MIHKIKVIPQTTASKILFFDEIDLDQLPDMRMVPLFGANGSGKTTLLNEIKNTINAITWVEPENQVERISMVLKGKKPPGKKQVDIDYDSANTLLFSYRNSKDNFGKMNVGFDPYYLKMKFDAEALSEGQSIVYSVQDLLKGMLRSTKRRESFVEDDKHAIVLLDEIDSGLSMDNIAECMRIIKRVLRQKRNIQFFMSFNNPYVCYFFPHVISMYDGKVHELSNLDSMLRELDTHREVLWKARRKRNGEFKIYE